MAAGDDGGAAAAGGWPPELGLGSRNRGASEEGGWGLGGAPSRRMALLVTKSRMALGMSCRRMAMAARPPHLAQVTPFQGADMAAKQPRATS
jgi:hypothetical protein